MTINCWDTNLVIALLNPHDRLHPTAVELAEKEPIIISQTVQAEARLTFLRKFNTAVIEVYKILNRARRADSEMELQKMLIDGFKELIQRRPELKAFYEYIYELIQEYGIRIDNIGKLPKMLNEHAIRKAANIQLPRASKIVDIDDSLYQRVSREVRKVNFKDLVDFQIFCEFCSLKTSENIVITTSDREFYKKGKKALNILISKGIIPKDKVDVRLID